MNNELVTQNQDLIQKLVLDGDISRMSQDQKVQYYSKFCAALGLNPLTQPFAIIKFQGKERLYAQKDCTEQLRKIHGVSITDISTANVSDVFVVTAKALDKTGKTDCSTGAVNIKGLTGEALANALMKAETKAKRRVTLSICGLGILDESETDTMPGFQAHPIDTNFDDIPDEGEKQLLRDLVFSSTLDESQRLGTLEKIEQCMDYKQYDLYRNKLESVQSGYDDVPNPNSTDAKKMVKKIVGKQPVEA
jgi:hypothetical protein